ncbi:MAG TPA: P-II family nitrogen regulator [Dehalococcoidia bacterium]|nr:P-II family nitrogen regulator [Dehalococcoidia bacterium]
MKKVEAIIRPDKLSVVRKALEEVGLAGLTVTEVKGHGTQRGITQQWRGVTYTVELLPKVKLELVVHDGLVERVLSVIQESARTGEIGDGKVFVWPVEDALRVRTGERGEAAL